MVQITVPAIFKEQIELSLICFDGVDQLNHKGGLYLGQIIDLVKYSLNCFRLDLFEVDDFDRQVILCVLLPPQEDFPRGTLAELLVADDVLSNFKGIGHINIIDVRV